MRNNSTHIFPTVVLYNFFSSHRARYKIFRTQAFDQTVNVEPAKGVLSNYYNKLDTCMRDMRYSVYFATCASSHASQASNHRTDFALNQCFSIIEHGSKKQN